MFSQPDPSYHGLVYTEHFKEAAYIGRCRCVYQRTTGAVLSPSKRVPAAAGNRDRCRCGSSGMWRTPRASRISCATIPGSIGSTTPDFRTIPIMRSRRNILAGRACSLMTFGVKGGFEAAKSFYDALKLIKRLVNLGDAKSLACHPASTTHRQMSDEEQRKAGVTPEMIRLSVGIEHVDDIIADLDQSARGEQKVRECPFTWIGICPVINLIRPAAVSTSA